MQGQALLEGLARRILVAISPPRQPRALPIAIPLAMAAGLVSFWARASVAPLAPAYRGTHAPGPGAGPFWSSPAAFVLGISFVAAAWAAGWSVQPWCAVTSGS